MSVVEEFRRNEQRVLDRLVDGELAPSDRRELLAALDDEPGAWRRCAVAFLEAQSLGRELSHLIAELSAASAPDFARRASSVASRPVPFVRRARFWSGGLAIAASLFLAFELGAKFAATEPAQSAGITQRIALVTPSNSQPQPAPSTNGDDRQSAYDQDLSDVGPNDSVTAGVSPWETLKVVLADDVDPDNEIMVRVLSADDDGEWLAGEQSDVSDELLRQLEQAGLEVVRQQRLWPVDLSDGRRIIVPVEDVEIRSPVAAKY